VWYRHKKIAINYFMDDPRLVFGIPSTPSKLHVASFIERAMDANIVEVSTIFYPRSLSTISPSRAEAIDRVIA